MRPVTSPTATVSSYGWMATQMNVRGRDVRLLHKINDTSCEKPTGTPNSKKIGAFHLERRESKPKAWVTLYKHIEMIPKADDSRPSKNEA